MVRPMRSLTLPPGLRDSSLPRIWAPEPSAIRFRRINGVRPIRSVIESAIGTRGTLPSPPGRASQASAVRASSARSASGRAPKWEMTSAAASAPSAADSACAQPVGEAVQEPGGEEVARAGGVDQPGHRVGRHLGHLVRGDDHRPVLGPRDQRDLAAPADRV